MKKILVTGGTGFVGSHILDFLVNQKENLNKDIQIFATRRYHLSRRDKILHLESKVNWLDCDLTESISVNKVIKEVNPNEIYHMAAESFVSPSWDHPTRYMQVNYNSTVNLLDAIKNYAPSCRILLPGSGEEYGLVELENLPINTSTKLQPVNPYAVSKIAQDLIGYVYYKSYGVNVIRVRTFNHEGPRRERYFGISSFAFQIARMELGLQPYVLQVGEIEDKRNFTHVYDIVNAYFLAMELAEPGMLYLIASEAEENIDTFRNIIKRLLTISNLKEHVKVELNTNFTRPTAVPYLIADSKDFRNLTGWRTSHTLDEILIDVLNYWRSRVKIYPDM